MTIIIKDRPTIDPLNLVQLNSETRNHRKRRFTLIEKEEEGLSQQN